MAAPFVMTLFEAGVLVQAVSVAKMPILGRAPEIPGRVVSAALICHTF
jgi:hypothetical protein